MIHLKKWKQIDNILMTSYFNEEKQEFDLEQWEVDSIKKDIL